MIDPASILTLAVREPIIETMHKRAVYSLAFCDPCKCWHLPGDGHKECGTFESPTVVKCLHGVAVVKHFGTEGKCKCELCEKVWDSRDDYFTEMMLDRPLVELDSEMSEVSSL